MKFLKYFILFSLVFSTQAYAACGFGSAISGGRCQGFLISSSGSTFTLPADWSNSNTIEACGEGGNSAAAAVGGGGGGGAYSAIFGLTDAAGTVENIQVGAGHSTTTTQFKNGSTLVADYGRSGSSLTGGAGGLASNSVGTTKFNGGAGGSNAGSGGGGGGGGGAGPFGAGANGAGTNFSVPGGVGGTGDNGHGGTAGVAGTEYNGSHGMGGGGSGTAGGSGNPGGAGGLYCSGGGGPGFGATTAGAGQGGLLIVTYQKAASGPSRGLLLQGDF